MKLNRLLPLIIPALVFLLEEMYYLSPKLIYVAAVLVNLLIFFTVWQFSQTSEIDKRWWNYLILPAVMSVAVMSYSVFLSFKLIIQLLYFFNLVFLYLYLRYVYYYLLNPLAYEVFSIENISSYINWLTFFLLAATVYGLASFLNLPISWLVLIMISLTSLLVYQIIWANKIELMPSLPYILISCLILVELFWSISFLPFNYNISGLSLAICYYVVIGLVKNHLLLKLDAAKVKMYLILGSISLLLVLSTAKWM
ncbi:hypothetical protein A3H09_02730 [Candidatus Falkowbacteria bacterium RIFCSPLOWO2_12_FULL_45_13]|uniref:Uncharacterized protein n=2 Tax=Candidatus Falkowiibacteriota TaxID=1752728 RepID=A0A1F5SCC3_9BACT|nr:MAG: hypothetical protein A3H66_02080 [Candidatus Falkowbacteria bacterium RIFCSPLOWO2_02_FULL_45_21]OGF29864.1 MAG: hypothetical protein A3H09_02730 [Candidatus Falkowbacteria bacterium RIFCSPLOWO2_12_FULL_45_13]